MLLGGRGDVSLPRLCVIQDDEKENKSSTVHKPVLGELVEEATASRIPRPQLGESTPDSSNKEPPYLYGFEDPSSSSSSEPSFELSPIPGGKEEEEGSGIESLEGRTEKETPQKAHRRPKRSVGIFPSVCVCVCECCL